MTGYEAYNRQGKKLGGQDFNHNQDMVRFPFAEKLDRYTLSKKRIYEELELYLHQYDRTTILPGLGMSLVSDMRAKNGNNPEAIYSGLIGIAPY